MKGMQKISRGRGFRGALDYAFERDTKGAEPGRLLGGNMSGQNARQLAAEFGQVRRTRPDIEKPVWHNALRLPKDEKLTDEQWVAIADDYMQRMGFTESHPRAYVLHDDADGQHIHIVASRVSTEGKVYLGKNENLASTRHIQALEREHNLTITKGPTYDADTGKIVMPESKQLDKNEVEMALRTNDEPPRQKLQRLINEAKADHPTTVQFVRHLHAAGVVVRPNLASTGRLNGFSFELNGVAFKGSQLGDQFTWKHLNQEISYDQTRDQQELERYRAGEIPNPIAAAGAHLDTADGNLRTARGAAANLDRTAGNITDRAARRAVGAYLKSIDANRSKVTTTTTTTSGEAMSTATIEREAPAVTSQNLFSIEAEEPLDRRQKMKAKILEEHYQAEIAAALARRLAYVKTGKDKVTIGLQDENGIDIGKLFDFGDRIEVSTGTDEQIAAALELAKAKGWKTMKFQGTPEFKKRASQMAADAGFEIKGYKPTPKPQPAPPPATLLDDLADLTGEAPKPTVTDQHEQSCLVARQRVQQVQATQLLPKTSEPLPVHSGDPYLVMCRSERQRVQGEFENTHADLAKVKTHDLDQVKADAIQSAQNDAHNAPIMDPLRRLFTQRQATTARLTEERERHAARGVLAKIFSVGKLANLEREAAQAKEQHIAAAKVVKQKLLNSEAVRGPIAWAQADNERHAKLTERLANLEREAQDLQAFESRLEQSGVEGKKHLQSVQRGRSLDPAEQRIHDLVRRHEQAQRLAVQIAEDKAKLERQLELAKQRELEEPTEGQHEVPRPR